MAAISGGSEEAQGARHGIPGKTRAEGVGGIRQKRWPSRRRNSQPATHHFRQVKLGSPGVIVDRRPNGTIHLRSPHPLPKYPEKLTERLVHWANVSPDKTIYGRSRRRRVAAHQLCGRARQGAPHRAGAAQSQPVSGTARRHPFRKRPRTSLADAGGLSRRHSGVADFARPIR